MKGPGEKEIETDRRVIRDKIAKLKKDLERIDKQSITKRKSRQQQKKVALVGYTNVGKSTLMNILGCLDRPTSGVYAVHEKNVSTLTPDELAALRRDTFGFVFQRYNLLTTVSAAENVEMPAIYAGGKLEDRRLRAQELLEKLGLGDRGQHRPNAELLAQGSANLASALFAGLPATGAILLCPPLKIKHGSGSPLRVLALVDRGGES